MEYKKKIYGAVVVLYEPIITHFNNIKSYCDLFNYIMVIDNSKKNNINEIKKIVNYDNKKIIYKHYPENIGLSKAFNIGIEYLSKYGCDWVITMDSDSKLISNLVSVYDEEIKNFSEKNIAVLAPVHIFDRSKNKKFNGTCEIEWSMTSGCAFNVSVFKKIGGFNTLLFVDGLDIEYCYRANKKGYKIIKCGKALIKHYPGETRKFKILGYDILNYGYASPWRYYLQSKAIIFIMLTYKKPKELIRYFSKWIKVIFLFDNKKQYVKEMVKGSIEGIKLWNSKT